MKAGDIVKVKVLEVDLDRKRVALTMRLDDAPGKNPGAPRAAAPLSAKARQRSERQPEPQGAMAAAFAKLRR